MAHIDRNHVYKELLKHSHPLKTTMSSFCNTINGKVSNASVNVQEALKLGESMLLDFRASLPDDFHVPLKRKVKIMESIKYGVAISDKTLCNMASLFCLLITVGQHRQTLLDYELCTVPASIIGEYGCLSTVTKSTLVFKLKVDRLQPDSPDIVIVYGQQLLYHIVGRVLGLLQFSPTT